MQNKRLTGLFTGLPHTNLHNNLNRINLILLQHIQENNNTNIPLLTQLLFMSQHFIYNDI